MVLELQCPFQSNIQINLVNFSSAQVHKVKVWQVPVSSVTKLELSIHTLPKCQAMRQSLLEEAAPLLGGCRGRKEQFTPAKLHRWCTKREHWGPCIYQAVQLTFRRELPIARIAREGSSTADTVASLPPSLSVLPPLLKSNCNKKKQKQKTTN